MVRHMKFAAGIGILSLILIGSAWSLPAFNGQPASGQGNIDEVDPVLLLRSPLDLDVLATCLGESQLRSDIEDELDAGHGCRHLGFLNAFTHASGHRDYTGCAAFVTSPSATTVLRWDYEYTNAANSPGIPPDSLTGSEESLGHVTGLAEVIIPDSVAYEFLVDEVLADPPVGMTALLSTHDLRELWVEKLGTANPVYRMYLQYVDADDNTRTEMIWATYTSGSFGVMESTF